MIVTVVASGESEKAIVVDIQQHELAWLMVNIVQPLAEVKRDYAGTLEIYEGDVTHKCSEEEWCEGEGNCHLIGSLDYNHPHKAVGV